MPAKTRIARREWPAEVEEVVVAIDVRGAEDVLPDGGDVGLDAGPRGLGGDVLVGCDGG